MGRQYKNPPLIEAVSTGGQPADMCHFRGYPEVFACLQEHPYLVSLLIEANRVIAYYFGRGTPVTFEVSTDPEAKDSQQLVAWIQTDLQPTEAIARLIQFDRDWWLAASYQSRGRLCIHVEYRPVSEPAADKKSLTG